MSTNLKVYSLCAVCFSFSNVMLVINITMGVFLQIISSFDCNKSKIDVPLMVGSHDCDAWSMTFCQDVTQYDVIWSFVIKLTNIIHTLTAELIFCIFCCCPLVVLVELLAFPITRLVELLVQWYYR